MLVNLYTLLFINGQVVVQANHILELYTDILCHEHCLRVF